MSYPFNYPNITNCDVQSFFGRKTSTTTPTQHFTWQKPQGASFVWFTLIGAGGNGASGDGASNGGGGGSGAVTNCLIPAFLLPDSLVVQIGTSTQVTFRGKGNSLYTVLSASAGSNGTTSTGGTGGTTTIGGGVGAAGLYQCVAGQDGVWGGPITASSTTFLSGGSGSAGGNNVTANYGYINGPADTSAKAGFFLTQPIIVGLGGSCSTVDTSIGNGGIGCGGSGAFVNNTTTRGAGGPGAVFIISW